MRTSENIAALAAALAKAQATLETAKKDAKGNFGKYADLASCWESARKALPPEGLCVIQTTRPSDNQEVVVITRLAHSSGEWIEGELAVPVTKNDAQGFGSALTYTRRYGLCAIVGIAPQEDDGAAASAARIPDPPALDNKIVAQFEAAADLAELANVWSALSPRDRANYTAVKDKAKARLSVRSLAEQA